jgi:hypothetical protein
MGRLAKCFVLSFFLSAIAIGCSSSSGTQNVPKDTPVPEAKPAADMTPKDKLPGK